MMSASTCLATSISGMFLVNKPKGKTSHDVVALIRKKGGFHRVGHGGTLDPMATGVLPVFVGKSTRLSELLHAWDKSYRFEVVFGETTDTGDAEGNILQSVEFDCLQRETLEAILPAFIGKRQQKPPMFSAVKQNGVPLYRLARKGIEVERESRAVEIYSLSILDVGEKKASFHLQCSKGTYVRTLAQEMGDALSLGGHVSVLERDGFGQFRIEDTVSLDQLLGMIENNTFSECLLLPDKIFQELPEIRIMDAHLTRVFRGAHLTGFQIYRTDGLFNFSETIRICDRKGKCIALGKGLVSSCELERLPKGLPVAQVEKLVGGF
ncbi:MAG: tRNA pseudouridine(55) synthase TruB [Leptospirales bacterium]